VSGKGQFTSTSATNELYLADACTSVIDNQWIGSVGNNITIGTGGFERMRVTNCGVIRIGACAVNTNANNNVLLQVSSAIRFGNPDGEYTQSYGGAVSARSCNTFAPGASRILLKGLGDVGFLLLVQGIEGANKFSDLLLGMATTVCVITSATTGTPVTRSYTIASENLNLCLSGATNYIVVATGFNAAER
jgi:hypothetical protein